MEWTKKIHQDKWKEYLKLDTSKNYVPLPKELYKGKIGALIHKILQRCFNS